MQTEASQGSAAPPSPSATSVKASNEKNSKKRASPSGDSEQPEKNHKATRCPCLRVLPGTKSPMRRCRRSPLWKLSLGQCRVHCPRKPQAKEESLYGQHSGPVRLHRSSVALQNNGQQRESHSSQQECDCGHEHSRPSTSQQRLSHLDQQH